MSSTSPSAASSADLPLPVAVHWSPKSPFVRKVLILLIECGLDAQVERVRTAVDRLNPNLAYMAENPLGTIPALVLADGMVLFDSAVICDYLLALRPRPDLLPPAGRRRFEVLRRQALADGMLDAILLWRQERLRPAAQQSAAFHAAYRLKAATALDRMQQEVAGLRGPLDLGQIATGCALAYLDLRFPDLDWRQQRDGLSDWHRRFEENPAARQTQLALDR